MLYNDNVINISSSCPQYYTHTNYSDQTRYYRLGLLNLPQNGLQARITLMACQGYNLADSYKSPTNNGPQNYCCNIYIYSGNAIAPGGLYGANSNSIVLDTGSNTSGQNDNGCFHMGFYEVMSVQCRSGTTNFNPSVSAVYLVPSISSPIDYVEIWVQNTSWWGNPLIEVSTNGTWYQNTAMTTALPNTGWVRLARRYENFVYRTN
jgi:hypothetical protein